MFKSWITKIKAKINRLLVVFNTKKLMKLNNKKKFLKNERTFKEHQFKERKEKLENRISDQKINKTDSKNLLDDLALKEENSKKEIEDKIASETMKLDKRILKHKEKLHILTVGKSVELTNGVSQDESIHLSISNLTMNFGGLKAVDDLSFDVKRGEIFGLIGPNGAGKTTVFNCITQFYKPNQGTITFNDQYKETHLLTNFKVHDIINLGIVRTFQNVELVWELSVLDNLLIGAHSLYTAKFFSQLLHLPKLRYEEKLIKAKAMDILTEFELLAYKDMLPYGLPYGILKKIEFARTLMTTPNLIILDEPAAGLNDSETLDLAKTIKKIRDHFGLTVFLVEHDMGLVMDICDTICAISFGKKLAIGTPSEIQNNKKVKEAYLGGE